MQLSDLSVVRAAHIILASASPRRSSILNEQLQLHARVVPSAFNEDLDKASFTPTEYVMETARQKALDVFGRCEAPFASKHQRPPSLVIGADTVVVLDGQVLEKPSSTENARQMLRALAKAGTHTVHTGVSLIYGCGPSDGDCHEHTFTESTEVSFKDLDDTEIEAYVASGEPMDKAGAYGIQGLGGAFVTGIVGDYHNVVGFPVARFCKELDVDRLEAWVSSESSNEQPPAPQPDASEDDALAPIVSDECTDMDECGLPSD